MEVIYDTDTMERTDDDPIVRCRDCVYYRLVDWVGHEFDQCLIEQSGIGEAVRFLDGDNGFCSWGISKQSENDSD